MKRLLLVLLFSGCGDGNPAPSPRAQVLSLTGPSIDQIKKDLIGQTFFFEYRDILGGRKWTIEAGEIVEAAICERATNSAAGTDEVDVFLRLRGSAETIYGNLVLDYQRFDQGWKLRSIWPKAGGRPPIPGAEVGGKSFAWEGAK